MSAHTTVNRPTRTSIGTLRREVIDVLLDDSETAYNATAAAADLLAEDTLVEEVSIDGMCGVY